MQTSSHTIEMLLQLPDYVVVCVCPLAGLSRVSHEHLAVALALEVPVACVITKADIAPPEAVQQVLGDIRCCIHCHPHIHLLCHLILCVMSCHVVSCHVMSCYVMSRHVTSCLMSCHVMSFSMHMCVASSWRYVLYLISHLCLHSRIIGFCLASSAQVDCHALSTLPLCISLLGDRLGSTQQEYRHM